MIPVGESAHCTKSPEQETSPVSGAASGTSSTSGAPLVQSRVGRGAMVGDKEVCSMHCHEVVRRKSVVDRGRLRVDKGGHAILAGGVPTHPATKNERGEGRCSLIPEVF